MFTPPQGGRGSLRQGRSLRPPLRFLVKLRFPGAIGRPGAVYPGTPFRRSMAQGLAQLIRRRWGWSWPFSDLEGGHPFGGPGRLCRGSWARRLAGHLARGIRAFHDDLGARYEDVSGSSPMSSFGRHRPLRTGFRVGPTMDTWVRGCWSWRRGHGGVGSWGRGPGFGAAPAPQGRDLAVTTDFRDLIRGRWALGHLGARDPEGTLPGHLLAPPGGSCAGMRRGGSPPASEVPTM